MHDSGFNLKKRIIAVAVGAAVNLILFFVKLYIGLSSNSIAIYADSINSLADFAVCVALLLGFVIGSAAASESFPFGKGKIEELTELLISCVILASGAVFAYISLERLMYPVPVWYSSLYAVIIAATAAVKLILFLFFTKISKKFGSDAIKGIATDSKLDFFITLCTLVSFTLADRAGFSVDGIAGIIISIILVAEGIKSFSDSFGKIIGKRNDRLCENAKRIIESDPSVICVKEIQYHAYGSKGVFTASIDSSCETAEEIRNLTVRLQRLTDEKFNSVLYVSFGGER